ncbi:MAG: secretin N-terminal domain-containing protein [Planctomycetota bacterium]|nr:secretin N-terminal domain-containing protein [Planctomycetota bacterium]
MCNKSLNCRWADWRLSMGLLAALFFRGGDLPAQFTIELSGGQVLDFVQQDDSERDEEERDEEERDQEERERDDKGRDGPPDADKIFSEQDRNKDGKLSADELPDEMKSHFKGIDRNKDGIVDRGEFSGAVRYFWEQEKRRRQRGEKKPEDEGDRRGGKDKTPQVKPLTRRGSAPGKPAAEELLAAPDEQGRVKFSFYGQKWDDVVDWVGRISGLSVDWTKLPGDYLNLRTPAASLGYTPAEVRDLINKHLLARGYTMIVVADGISIYPTEDLNNALVPRIRSSELHTRMPYDFVKVSFRLNWILAGQAAEEFKPYISKNGKLVALNTTNRIEAMDAVANLRQLAEMIGQEQSADTQDDLVTEIRIQHQRASKIREKLAEFLSFEIKEKKAGQEEERGRGRGGREMWEAMKRMQEALKRGGGRRPQGKAPEKISVIVNESRNSLIVSAPPDKMVRIRQAVQLLDVPTTNFRNADSYVERMRVYRLVSLDPQEVITILEETGGLTHEARLQVDAKAKAVVAHAPPEDHFVIQKLVARLDGAGRRFEVVPLRRLLADEVAGTVGEMIGKPAKQQRGRREWWEDWGDWNRRNQDEDSGDQFKVSADIENNRLLLWCNDMEYKSVRELLEKLGELYRPGSNLSKVRQLDVSGVGDVDGLLKQVQEQLRNVAPEIQLELPEPAPEVTPIPVRPERVPLKILEGDSGGSLEEDAKEPRNPMVPDPGNEARKPRPRATFVADATVQAAAREKAAKASAARVADRILATGATNKVPDDERERLRRTVKPPPGFIPQQGPAAQKNAAAPLRIKISRGEGGQLVVSSADPAALDALEEVLGRMLPRRKKNWKKFDLKYASASWVKFNLDDFFRDDESNNRRSFFDRGWGRRNGQDQSSQLSTRRKVRFIDDPDTNTIVVLNASQEQLGTITELIEIYDIPEPVDSQAARVTKLITVRYSRATLIAEAIKEAYRDLLSSNDKTFQRGRQGDRGGERFAGGGETFIRSFFGGQQERPTSERARITFKGQLSIGVDETSNSLIVSTTGEGLMKIVEQMVAALDKAAQPARRVETVELSGRVNGAYLKRMLTTVIAEKETKNPDNRRRRDEGEEREEEDRRRDREREMREQREDMIRRFFD